MANPYFKFKQFTVYHDRCAMKVGTDGVLLGAWATVKGDTMQILDVGTGTGLIALQLAQRCPQAHITAVDIDVEAARQARDNALSSPWWERVEVVCLDFKDFCCETQFDLIVSNPPYFVDALKCPDRQRNTARHTDIDSLNYATLFGCAARLLRSSGTIDVIIPAEVEENVLVSAMDEGLCPHRRLQVFTKPGKPCRRILLSFGFEQKACQQETLCIEHEHHCYTPEYIALTKDFYLNM